MAVVRGSPARVVDLGDPGWWQGSVSGVRVRWEARAAGLAVARVDGDPIDPDATYTIATSAYLLHTDHEFPTLGERHRTDEAGLQYEVLAAYARAVGIDPVVEGRIEWGSEADPAL